MKRFFKVIGIIAALLSLVAIAVYFFYLKPKHLPISLEDRAAITLMPLPASLKMRDGEFFFNTRIWSNY